MIEINKAKSGILQIRVDKRTPTMLDSNFNGITFFKSYRYLGVVICDDLSMSENIEAIKI